MWSGLARGAVVSGRGLWQGRAIVVGILVRGLWWGALLLGMQTLLQLLDTSESIDVDGAMLSFTIGLGLCAAVTALAQARRLRWAAIALGTTHGAAALLLHGLAAG
jgi:hypothetical protein